METLSIYKLSKVCKNSFNSLLYIDLYTNFVKFIISIDSKKNVIQKVVISVCLSDFICMSDHNT